MKTMLALTAALATSAATPALACGRPPEGWSITATLPADGATDVPRDGVIVVEGEELYPGWSSPFDQSLRVEVTLGGMPVEGAVGEQLTDGLGVWRAAGPLAPETEYVAVVRVENVDDFGGEPQGDLERTIRFTTGPDVAGESRWGEGDAVVSPRLAEVSIIECIEEDDVGSCEPCREERTVGHQQHLRASVRVPAPAGPWTGAYVARIRYAVSRDAVETGALKTAAFGAGDSVGFDLELGPRRSWSTDELCVRPSVVDPLGHAIDGEVTCVGIPPYVPEDDDLLGDGGGGEGGAGGGGGDLGGAGGVGGVPAGGDPEEDVDEGGCSASGLPVATSPLLILVLAGARRRRPR